MTTLNKHQLDILTLFNRELEDSDFKEIKRLIVQYFADKLQENIASNKSLNSWNDEKIDALLNSHKRTKYQ